MNKIYDFYQDLLKRHGHPKKLWPQWCAEKKDERLREIIAVGAVLTQRTSWRNADLALRNLKKKNLLCLEKLARLAKLDELRELIRPAGFFQTKPKRLVSLAKFVMENYGSLEKFKKENLKRAREKLLDVYGVGPETADTILLYGLDKSSFVIDAYTKKLVESKKWSKTIAYDYLKEMFEKNLPKNVEIYQNYHTLMIVEQKGRKHCVMEEI